MLRRSLLWLSERRGIYNLVKRNGIARGIAGRFVAGESVDEAIQVGRALNARGVKVSLDLLGESVTSALEAEGARDEVLDTIDAIARAHVDANVSVKLTQLGLDISYDLCAENMRTVLSRAQEHGIFVRIDMEGSAYTERTLTLFCDELQHQFGDLTGVVIQSCLRRSERDVAKLITRHARVRLCKGAYAEAAAIAFPDKRDVDACFATLMEQLLEAGNYPAIATHDENLITHALAFTDERSIGAERFEFQMLYGVRRDLQDSLREKGYTVRVYVPFGTAWYPYLMRRLAERPANVVFVLGSLTRETFSRR